MNRRGFLTALAAAIVVTPLAPLIPKVKTWTSAPIDMSLPPMVKVPQYLYLTTPFPIISRETFLREIGYDFNDYFINGEHAGYRAKLDWPVGQVKFDDKTLLRLTAPIAK